MIESIQFKNFKVLRDATLPLSRFTLIIGPNGSGKSTALEAFRRIAYPQTPYIEVVTAGAELSGSEVLIKMRWGGQFEGGRTIAKWSPGMGNAIVTHEGPPNDLQLAMAKIAQARIYSFDANAISGSVTLKPSIELEPNGTNLAGILDQIRDRDPERFEAINEEVQRWLPEYDRVLFNTPDQGQRAFRLRARQSHYSIPASNLSQGTLFALALLTLAYLPDAPPIVCLEEPDHGIHPRLLRDVRDALYRLSYPEDFGEKREPVQVIATTHSPYLLDLYKDHPEEVVIAQKGESGAYFERLSDRDDLEDILQGAHLSELWYSGILGGVPATR